MEITDGTPCRAMASFDPYEGAQALVDRLVDEGFPVERLAIVGRDLEIVERVMLRRRSAAGWPVQRAIHCRLAGGEQDVDCGI